MAPHQRRVVEEKRELDNKLSKLSEFLMTPMFACLPEEEKGRLTRQHTVMEEYSRILRERIAAFVQSDIGNQKTVMLTRNEITMLADAAARMLADACWDDYPQEFCDSLRNALDKLSKV